MLITTSCSTPAALRSEGNGSPNPTTRETPIPRTAAPSATRTAWSMSPPTIMREGAPVALNTAKSRMRSIAERYTIRPMIPAAMSHINTAMTTIDWTPPSTGRLRSLSTCGLVSSVVPAGGRAVPWTAIAIAKG